MLSIWFVEQVMWGKKKGTRHGKTVQLLVEATNCREAARLAGDNDGVHEIRWIKWLGPVVARERMT